MDGSHVSALHDSEEYRTAEAYSELVDRLSELPDSLILEILSFLPMRDVVTTTLLSKRWEGLWTTVPGLDFRNPTYDDLNMFRSFVNRVLALWRGAKIQKFCITFMVELSTSYLGSLLQFAIEKQVEELYIELEQFYVSPRPRESDYYAPQCLYSCSSITKLTLVSVTLKTVETVRWNQLKSLTIQGVDSLIEHAMSHILSGSPHLEVLNLCIRESGKDLNIESASLKMLVIDMYLVHCSDNVSKGAVLRILAPNLESLEIYGVSYCRCLLNVPSLTSAVIGFDERDWFMLLGEMLWRLFVSICHVEKLTLTDWCIKFLLEMKKKDMLVQFSDAKFLKLYPGEANGMLDVLEVFPELKMLVIEHNEVISLFKDEEEPCVTKIDECNTLAPKAIIPNHSISHLKTVEITWHLRDASIIPIIEILLENAHTLEEMVLRLRTCGADPEMFVLAEEKVQSMARSFPGVKVIISEVC